MRDYSPSVRTALVFTPAVRRRVPRRRPEGDRRERCEGRPGGRSASALWRPPLLVLAGGARAVRPRRFWSDLGWPPLYRVSNRAARRFRAARRRDRGVRAAAAAGGARRLVVPAGADRGLVVPGAPARLLAGGRRRAAAAARTTIARWRRRCSRSRARRSWQAARSSSVSGAAPASCSRPRSITSRAGALAPVRCGSRARQRALGIRAAPVRGVAQARRGAGSKNLRPARVSRADVRACDMENRPCAAVRAAPEPAR